MDTEVMQAIEERNAEIETLKAQLNNDNLSAKEKRNADYN